MKLDNINEARKNRQTKQHTARIAGKEYTDLSFVGAKKRASSLGATRFYWDDVPYVFRNRIWVIDDRNR